jgi:hypothetical protein
MNCIYRSIWNNKSGTFVAVSENTKSAGKKNSLTQRCDATSAPLILKAAAISLMMAFGANVYALPAGGVVVGGSANASISSSASTTTITQSAPSAVINWWSFSIAPGEAVQVLQSNSSMVLLNRVQGPDPSSILGRRQSISGESEWHPVRPGRASQCRRAGRVNA